MADDNSNEVGSIVWTDLTTDNAERTREFYEAVVGWTSSPVSMGDYDDFNWPPRRAAAQLPGYATPVAAMPTCRRSGSCTSSSRISMPVLRDVLRWGAR